jgi:hypothetical protein
MGIKVSDLLAASPPAPVPEVHYPWKPWMKPGDPPYWGMYETREIALARQASWDSGSAGLVPYTGEKPDQETGVTVNSDDPIPALQPDPPPA